MMMFIVKNTQVNLRLQPLQNTKLLQKKKEGNQIKKRKKVNLELRIR